MAAQRAGSWSLTTTEQEIINASGGAAEAIVLHTTSSDVLVNIPSIHLDKWFPLPANQAIPFMCRGGIRSVKAKTSTGTATLYGGINAG